MTVSTSSPLSGVCGSQRPRVESAPESSRSVGSAAVALAELAGLHLDDWQKYVLEVSLGETEEERWSAFEVALVVARQNGKTALLEARELAGLFLLNEQLIIHSAHEFKAAREAFYRVRTLVESTPQLKAEVANITTGAGNEGIELKSGQRLRFVARTGSSGRGFSGDCVILDEAFNLPQDALGALLPTLSARPNPQIWYASSAVDQKVHTNGLVLAKLRERGLAGGDPSLCYLEWSVDPDRFAADPTGVAADPEAWAEANPGLGIRIDPEHVERELRSMALSTFATERLSVGDWPATTVGDSAKIPLDMWRMCADPSAVLEGTVAFAFDVTPDRRWASIGVAGRTDGRLHVEVVDHREGTGWVVPRLVELVGRWGPCAVVVDSRSPAASLIPDLVEHKIEVASGDPSGDELLVRTSAGDMAQACGLFYDAAMNGGLMHLGCEVLEGALASAKERPLGDAWAWARKGSGDISPLVAVTLATWGMSMYGSRTAELTIVGWV